MSLFQLPDVTDLLAKRTAYVQAKEAFLGKLLSHPILYTASHESLTLWLETCVGDAALMTEICASVAAGPPIMHWGEEEAACQAFETVRRWQLINRFSDAVTCKDCQEVYAQAKKKKGLPAN
jgi:hypothetical protein